MPPNLALAPVLVVEDDANDMFLFTRLLKAAGAANALHIALDGREAIRLLTPIVEKNRLVAKPALAFVDVRMPHFSGLEVLAWIRQQRELDDLAVAMMSAAPERAEIERAATLGAQCFLTKFPRTLAISRLLEGAARFSGHDGPTRFDLPDNLLRPLPRRNG